MTETPLLSTRGLSRHFGGLTAVNKVDFDVFPGQIHAVLGPNGAGKSTLINMLSGELPPSHGEIQFRQRPIHGLPIHRIARLGIGRSYQKTSIFPRLSCLDNCRLAARIHQGGVIASWRSRALGDRVNEAAEKALETSQLTDQAYTPAHAMSYGEQRQLQIAMVLATAPILMLLDEPMAGMGREETIRVTELLRTLSSEYALVLIEHDMDSVFSLAHQITVMVDGSVLETGTTEAIRKSPRVRDVYLGRHFEEEGAA
ncbi:ABC transporter ATP-binding protein [Marinobacter sp.]|uniref:ABC transporter ATP-binding protein n=1 Tax=Marinobacter sp. TaxID=50741 RepID=UPI003851143B